MILAYEEKKNIIVQIGCALLTQHIKWGKDARKSEGCEFDLEPVFGTGQTIPDNQQENIRQEWVNETMRLSGMLIAEIESTTADKDTWGIL